MDIFDPPKWLVAALVGVIAGLVALAIWFNTDGKSKFASPGHYLMFSPGMFSASLVLAQGGDGKLKFVRADGECAPTAEATKLKFVPVGPHKELSVVEPKSAQGKFLCAQGGSAVLSSDSSLARYTEPIPHKCVKTLPPTPQANYNYLSLGGSSGYEATSTSVRTYSNGWTAECYEGYTMSSEC